MRAFLILFLSACTVFAASNGEPALTIKNGGEVATFTTEQFAQLPHVEITVFDGHTRQEHKYSGVPVSVLLERVHTALGEKLRGAALQSVVHARSRDGYVVVFSLAEFDPAFSARTIMLADREDGHALRETAAPFQLITPGDKRPARWARMVTSLEVSTVSKP